MIKIKAVIMSGGKGTRLRPLTCHLPKPMVPILNKPVMEYAIELLKKYKIEDIAVTLAYLPSSIIDYFGDGSEFGVNLNYFIEETPLGTGGSVKNAEDFLQSTFVVVSGDAFTNINLQKALDFHKRKGSKATLILKKEAIPLEYGVIITDKDGKIIRFLEKPSWGEVFSDTINTGIYILEPEVLDYYKKGDNFDFSKDLFPRLLKDGIPMYGYVTDEYWCDVGDLESYIQTHEDLLQGKISADFNSQEIEKGIWIGEGTIVSRSAEISPPVYIGENCIIKSNVKLEPYTVIGDNCFIDEGSSIKKSIVWDNVMISRGIESRKSIICDFAHIGENARMFENSVVGSSSIVSSGATVNPHIKIWPHKKIESDAIVSENLVWGEKVSKNLFGHRDISGYINVDITPEFSSRLGSSFASVVDHSGTFIVSSDEFNSSNLVKNSILSGILSTGAKVVDLKNVSTPMCRFAIRHFKAQGGVHVSANNKDRNIVHIEFLDKNGANIGRNIERKIENSFAIEDFKRCNSDEIKEIVRIYNFSSIYIKEGENILKNVPQIKSSRPKILISSKSKNIAEIGREYLHNIGCEVQLDYSVYEFDKKEEYIKHISETVVRYHLDAGIIYSENGENIILIDDKGRVIHKEKLYLLIFAIGFESGEFKKIVVPNNFPRIVKDIADRYGGDIFITKTNLADIMNTMIEKDCLNQYIFNFDGICASGKIIDFLSSKSKRLSQLANELPEYYFIQKQISCDWEDKGKIVRLLIENNEDEMEMFEGVRLINDKGWVLIIPDEEKPAFNLYAEGSSEELAEELTSFYGEKIKKLLKGST